jgi:phage gpG-like protein
MFLKVKDTITPSLKKRALVGTNTQQKRLLKAMGMAVTSMAVRAFTDPGLRPSPWLPRKDNLPHNLLQKNTELIESLYIIDSSDKVKISSSKIYAAIHQHGGKAGRGHKSTIPARPYLPIKGRKLTPRGQKAVHDVLKEGLRTLGL